MGYWPWLGDIGCIGGAMKIGINLIEEEELEDFGGKERVWIWNRKKMSINMWSWVVEGMELEREMWVG